MTPDTTGPTPSEADVSGTQPNSDLKSLPMPEVEKRLATSPDGLSQTEAGKRLAQYGPVLLSVSRGAI